MGAEISWTDGRLTISGAERLSGGEWEVIPDRIEAGTYLIAGPITRGEVEVRGVIPEHLAALTEKLREAGVEVEGGPDWLRARAAGPLRGVELATAPYPGFPTDLQPPMVSLLALASGRSQVEERVFKSRFGHVPGLIKMGASLDIAGNRILISGVEGLRGADVEAPDIRAGAALVLAALAARGTSRISGLEHLDRGYENLVEKLRKLGAEICRGTDCL
jgi:UDP-N-acetylglucosamine 1-carboxyvinyltransferase